MMVDNETRAAIRRLLKRWGRTAQMCKGRQEEIERYNGLIDATYGLHAQQYSGMPHGSGISNPTAMTAEQADKLREALAAYEEAIPFERITEAADLLNHKAPKTLREDFMENYPHAILDEFGYPNDTCPAALLGASCPYTDKPTCMRCPMWDKPAK